MGLAWTRLPDKHVWQVALTLLVPLLLAISALELEAGTMRAFADDDGKRVKLVFGAMALLVWVALFWACWAVLDWCDDQIPQWAGYLNSRGSAGERATVFTYDHLQKWMTLAEWILRWIIVPGKIIPYAIASAQWGWRIPFRRIIRLLLNWRWWPAVVVSALASVLLPGHFFAALPQGTVSHQVWAVSWKLVASYVLVVGCWILLLAWAAVLIACQPEPAEDALDQQLAWRLWLSRKWLAGVAVCTILGAMANLIETRAFDASGRAQTVGYFIGIVLAVTALAGLILCLTGGLRSMVTRAARRTRFPWAALSVFLWLVVAMAVDLSPEFLNRPIISWLLEWVVIPAVLIPVGVACAQNSFHIPWTKTLLVAFNSRWLAGVVLAGIFASGLPALFEATCWDHSIHLSIWHEGLLRTISGMLEAAGWALMFAWAALLLDRCVYSNQLPPEAAKRSSGNA